MKPKVPMRVKSTPAQLVDMLFDACAKHGETVKLKKVIDDPGLNTRSLKNDDFAKMMQLRRTQR